MQRGFVEPVARWARRSERLALEVARQAVRGEEPGRVDRASEEHVVVEVDDVLGESVDVVQPRLDGVGVERRQDGLGQDLRVGDEVQPVVLAQPRWPLVGRDDEDAPQRTGVEPERAEQVAQLVV